MSAGTGQISDAPRPDWRRESLSSLATMSRWLRAFGYRVESFISAADFLLRRPIEIGGCVIADLQMPGMDGMALQRALVQPENPLPIIFLTGRADIPASVRAMRNGAEDFLVKTAAKEEMLSPLSVRWLARLASAVHVYSNANCCSVLSN